MTIEDMVKKIQSSNSVRRPLLIAVEGYGGAGKTTFAYRLSGNLGDAYVVHMDDFIVKERLAEPSWDKGSFDRERLEQQVLKPILSGKVAKYQKLIWSNNSLGDYIEVPKARYVIVEGVSSFHPNISHYYDYRIWIDTPMAIAKERGHTRDGSSENAQFWDLWAANDLRYQEKYHPELQADFVLDN